MTRRKVFDPGTTPASFWRRQDVQVVLARRDIAELFRCYLSEFSECTQTQLALLTEHDRSDVSNWVRGTRQGRVSDIEVLTRIAEGLRMPDEARILMGLAPADALVSSVRDERALSDGSANVLDEFTRHRLAGSSQSSTRIAISGSRADGTSSRVIDAAVRSLASLVVVRHLLVNHGPIGVGIEVMTHIADHFRPPGLRGAVALFGRRNIVVDADYVVVVGGAQGTRDEVDLATSMDKRIIALGASGGTAAAVHDRLSRDRWLRAWMPDDAFAELDACSEIDESGGDSREIDSLVERFVRVVDHLINDHGDQRD